MGRAPLQTPSLGLLSSPPVDGHGLVAGTDVKAELELDIKITSAMLYHPDLENLDENTILSGNNVPSRFYMFSHHQQRMLAAIDDLQGEPPKAMLDSISGVSGLENMRVVAMQSVHTGIPAKARFTLDLSGRLECTSLELGVSTLSALVATDYFPTITSLIDPARVCEDSILWLVSICRKKIKAQFTTRHKTTRREHYERAFKDASSSFPTGGAEGRYRIEALVVNELDQIMEGCSTTPYFWRHGYWVTPSAECGGNLGTTRRWALDKQLVSEDVILREDVRHGEIIVLSNGVRGFGFGKIVKI